MDLTTSGLAGINEKFNNILKKVDSVADTMKAQIQGDASAAAAAIGGDLSSLTGELRNLIPQGATLPNINLQSQLSSLASISNPAQAANLLSNPTSSSTLTLSVTVEPGSNNISFACSSVPKSGKKLITCFNVAKGISS